MMRKIGIFNNNNIYSLFIFGNVHIKMELTRYLNK